MRLHDFSKRTSNAALRDASAAEAVRQWTDAPAPQSLDQALVIQKHLAKIGYSISSVFFGCYGVCIGYLVFRSTFLPRVIGVLLAFGALSYLTYGVAYLLAPAFAFNLVPWIQLPSLLGEGSFCLWLLIAIVNAKRWEERAGGPIGQRSTPIAAPA